MLPSIIRCFTCNNLGVTRKTTSQTSLSTSSLFLAADLDQDAIDITNFDQYDLTELPDIMVDSTVWVGNLNEFVTDNELGNLFGKYSETSLMNVPSVIARRPNNESLRYGFVYFPTSADAQTAAERFDGFVFEGRPMKVELFKDSKQSRAKVPEKLVNFVLGSKKNPHNGAPNKLRRISRDDVERLSKGQPSKKKNTNGAVPHRLSDQERLAFDRAAKYGFVTLNSTGFRRGRKGSPLANIHRQWCDARSKPQIIVCKATGGRPLDNVIVDLSPLRIEFSETADADLFYRWKSDILVAAESSGMMLNYEILEDNTLTIDTNCDNEGNFNSDQLVVGAEAWLLESIWNLPAVSLGVFEGQRSAAKSMAKELAGLWDVPDSKSGIGDGTNFNRKNGEKKSRKKAGSKGGDKTKNKGRTKQRQKKVDFDF